MEMQDDYRNYLLILKRICDNNQKESTDSKADLSDEKKNSFVVINRKPEYLKQSVLDYLRKHKLENKLHELKPIYSFGELNRSQIKTKNKKIQKRKKLGNNLISLFNKNITNDGLFIWPINPKEFWVSSFFGKRYMRRRKSNFHYGIDMAAIKGTEVKAAADGTVIEAFYSKGYGNTILIMHDQKFKTRYAHLNSIKVKNGESVKKGQKIGTVGDTGYVRSSGRDASHLHFEVIEFGKRINPLYVLK